MISNWLPVKRVDIIFCRINKHSISQPGFLLFMEPFPIRYSLFISPPPVQPPKSPSAAGDNIGVGTGCDRREVASRESVQLFGRYVTDLDVAT